MKRKLLTVVIIVLMLLGISINVQAVGDFTAINMRLPENFVQINTKDAETKEYYEQNHIYLHATNEEQNESIMLVQLENELTTKIVNLKQINEEELKHFIENYNTTKEQAKQTILKQETYEKEDMLFIDTVLEQTTNENTIQTNEYYTIYDGKAIIVSYGFLNKEVDTSKVRTVIDSILISNKDTTNNRIIILCVLILALGVLYCIKQTKGKTSIDENEKQKMLPKIVQYMSKVDYSKFKGILILFVITIILNIINLSIGIVGAILNERISYGGINQVYNILSVMQNVIQLLGIIYIAYCLTKRKVESIKKIKNTFIAMLIAVMTLTIIRLVLTISLGDFWYYLKSEIQVISKSIVYILIWYLYFRNSIRVSVFYGEKTIEQIIIKPKKLYQENLVNKEIMELKIIQYFEDQKALDYESGIYINKLPKEYAKSVAISNLQSKKIIRLKRAKYYLSKKNLENPKTEQKQVVKIVGMITVIYIIAVLLLYSF